MLDFFHDALTRKLDEQRFRSDEQRREFGHDAAKIIPAIVRFSHLSDTDKQKYREENRAFREKWNIEVAYVESLAEIFMGLDKATMSSLLKWLRGGALAESKAYIPQQQAGFDTFETAS